MMHAGVTMQQRGVCKNMPAVFVVGYVKVCSDSFGNFCVMRERYGFEMLQKVFANEIELYKKH
jgi:hypothetical protein